MPELMREELLFQSTHPVRGATLRGARISALLGISIHAPREGCDLYDFLCAFCIPVISIHAPREGCDTPAVCWPAGTSNFNPRTP